MIVSTRLGGTGLQDAPAQDHIGIRLRSAQGGVLRLSRTRRPRPPGDGRCPRRRNPDRRQQARPRASSPSRATGSVAGGAPRGARAGLLSPKCAGTAALEDRVRGPRPSALRAAAPIAAPPMSAPPPQSPLSGPSDGKPDLGSVRGDPDAVDASSADDPDTPTAARSPARNSADVSLSITSRSLHPAA